MGIELPNQNLDQFLRCGHFLTVGVILERKNANGRVLKGVVWTELQGQAHVWDSSDFAGITDTADVISFHNLALYGLHGF